MTTKNTHGGARPGSGRPREIKDPVRIGLYLSRRQTKQLAKAATRAGLTRNEALRRAIAEYLAK